MASIGTACLQWTGEQSTLTVTFKMSGLEKSLFNLKFTAKQLNRQAQKAGKDEVAEKAKLKKVSSSPRGACVFWMNSVENATVLHEKD